MADKNGSDFGADPAGRASGLKALAEEWKYVRGYEGLYKVSNYGGILSCRSARLLSPHKDQHGYLRIGLWDGERQRKFRVHQLVAEAFVPGKNVLHREIAHLDGNSSNPRADNLKWVSKVENHFHMRAHGTHPTCERHPRAKLTPDIVRHIRVSPLNCGELGRLYGVSQNAIWKVRARRTWQAV